MKPVPSHEKKTELEVRNKEEVLQVAEVPDYLRMAPTEPIRGSENVESHDFIMPRLSICSKQTPQYDASNEKYIEGLKLGDFFNTITREVYGPTVYVTPLFELKTRALSRPYGDNGPPFCSSFDGKLGEGDPGGICHDCPKSQWTTLKGKDKNQKPECTEFLNFACLLLPTVAVPKNLIWNVMPRIDTISILGFKATSFKQGQEWISKLKLRNRDWFTTVFKLVAVPRTDGKNSWHIPVADNAGWLSEMGAQVSKPCYESIHGIYKQGGMRVDETERPEEET